jgi:hypothetical protein
LLVLWYWCYCWPASLFNFSFYNLELHYYRERVIGHDLVIHVMWVSVWISLLRYNANKNIDKAMAVSSNTIMIVIGIHFCLFSVALCLKGDNVCDVRISRCVRIIIYLFISEIILVGHGLYEILTCMGIIIFVKKNLSRRYRVCSRRSFVFRRSIAYSWYGNVGV